jgi:uncharacterized protein (TIGR04222 family)
VNPFDLRGPEFLLFYAIYAALVLVGMVLVRRRRELRLPAPKLDLADPYLVAYLRAGRAEAVRVALLSLADRKLVTPGDPDWTAEEGAADRVSHPLEKALLPRFVGGDRPERGLLAAEVEAACDELKHALEGMGLLPGPDVTSRRMADSIFAAMLLVAPAIIKIGIALLRGRHNIWFLVIAAVIAVFLAFCLPGGRRTARGARTLADLRSLFSGLRRRADRIAPGGSTSELALLAAVFGLSLVPLAVFPHAEALAREAVGDGWTGASGGWSGGSGWSSSSSTSYSSSSSWSSCSSSSGSSCGSSCGGGGGGCGGCGS